MIVLRSTVRTGTTRKVVESMLHRGGLADDLAFCPEHL